MCEIISTDPLRSFLAEYPVITQDLVLKIRDLIMEVLPGAIEQVDAPSRIIAYGYGTKYADLICAIAPYTSHVNLMFSRGATLADPEGLLTGTGKKARHVRLTTEVELVAPAVRRLLETARDHHR